MRWVPPVSTGNEHQICTSKSDLLLPRTNQNGFVSGFTYIPLAILWVDYHDLTALSLESWSIYGKSSIIIPFYGQTIQVSQLFLAPKDPITETEDRNPIP